MSHGGDAPHFLNQHLADFCRIGRRTAPEQANVRGLDQRAVVKPHTAEAPGAHVPVNPPRNALSKRIGLFVDFLVHVGRCITEFRLTPRIFEHRNARFNRVPFIDVMLNESRWITATSPSSRRQLVGYGQSTGEDRLKRRFHRRPGR